MDTSERTVYRGQITKLVKSAHEYLNSSISPIHDTVDSSVIEEELVSFIDRLTAAKTTLDKINCELRPSIKAENATKEFESICEYEDKATGMLARLNNRLKTIRASSDWAASGTHQQRVQTEQHRSSSSCNSKLPKLSLKVFNGNFIEWIPFWERFRTAVHERQDISGADKFNYLSSNLAGKAAECIAGFTPSSANYDAALALLSEQFGDNDRLVSHIMHNLMNMPKISSRHDIVSLRTLYNNVIANTRSLTVLNVPSTQYSIMLRTLLLRCLPRELVLEYHRKCADNKFEKLSSAISDDENVSVSACCGKSSLGGIECTQLRSILSFLKREVFSLESVELTTEKAQRAQSNHSKALKTATGLLTSTKEATIVCYFCNSHTHTTAQCNTARNLLEKKDILKQNGCCFKCTKKGHNSRNCNCRIKCSVCSGRHASSMCDPEYRARLSLGASNSTVSSVDTEVNDKQSSAALCSSSILALSTVLLQTALVIVSNDSNSFLIRIILDGGSQRTFIKRSVVMKLQLQVYDTIKMHILPFGSSKQYAPKNFERVKVKLQSRSTNQFVEVLAVVVPDICPDVLQPPNITDSNVLNGLVLADDYNLRKTEDEIGVLLGADAYWTIVKDEFKRITDKLVAVNTIFGWTLHGSAPLSGTELLSSVNLAIDELDDNTNFSRYEVKHIEKLWCIDEIPSAFDIPSNTDDIINKYVRDNGKRYQASLLWKNENCAIDSNRHGALIRFKKLVNKLERNPDKLRQYDAIIQEMISLGIAKKCNDVSNLREYYMPHRPVYRLEKDTTKIRIVFDASSRSSEHFSLNELLWAGPNLLPKILSLLLNFRLGKYAVVADIEKAFLQVELDPKDYSVHRFFWLSELEDLNSIIVLNLTRMTVGVTCSPFLLCAVLKKHFLKLEHKYPETIRLLLASFYVDDLVLSVDELNDAVRLYTESCEILKNASMNLRKWKTNNDQLRKIFSEESYSSMNVKVLGVTWDIENDKLSVEVEKEKITSFTQHCVTKRKLLQLIASIFDPLGICAPCVMKLKILFQETWRQKLPWDETLPTTLMTDIVKLTSDFHLLPSLTLPRCVFNHPRRIKQELHIFSDASPKAYGSVAFIRSIYTDKITTVEFLCSKSRLAPLGSDLSKELTLPKMELAAASVSAKLLNYLNETLRLKFDAHHLWTDSKIALFWIVKGNFRRNAYVDNRVHEIRRLTDIHSWHHCSGSTNPADLLTRGVSVKTLLSSTCWRHGPEWLKDESEWPVQDSDLNDGATECNNMLVAEKPNELLKKQSLLPLENFSQYRRLMRVTSYVLRFTKRLRGIKSCNKHINANEIKDSEYYWIKFVQANAYCEEITALSNNGNCTKSSKILSLNPFLDPQGILRVGSRLSEGELSYEETFPILLPYKTHFTSLLIYQAHERVLHGSTNMVLVQLRLRFWVVKARQAVKSVINKCTVCKRFKGKAANQPFAPLPKERLVSTRPFETAGVDFAGPLYIRNSPHKDTTRKVYILLITCAVTRAVHLELVLDLKAESCVSALRRFFARRGIPSLLMSDNAKTFRRTALEFRQLHMIIQSEEFQNYITNKGISWRFIVERAAWWGGFWERLVKIVKDLLKVSIQRATLNFDQLNTYLTEVEFIVNARPLTYVSSDPADLSPLTPAHFLLGCFLSTLAINKSTFAADQEIRSKWQSRFRLANSFFRRFRNEYICALRSAHHNRIPFSRGVKSGDVVVVHDTSCSRLFWKLAKIEKTLLGRDGRVRACEIKLPNGVITRRAIQHLYPLEINSLAAGGCEK